MPTLQSRFTCHTLKKKHVFWYPLGSRICKLFPNTHFQMRGTKTYQNVFGVLFLSWYTHHCAAGNPIALLHHLKGLWPTSAYIWAKMPPLLVSCCNSLIFIKWIKQMKYLVVFAQIEMNLKLINLLQNIRNKQKRTKYLVTSSCL